MKTRKKRSTARSAASTSRSEEKPPFGLPSMAEIRESAGTTGLKMVSTFSGCGGSCLGFEMAGFDVVYATEFVEAARDTYRLNHPEHVFIDPRDVRAVQSSDILAKLGLEKGELDVFEGSPPCSSFSTAGKRDKGWGEVKGYSDTKQRTDDLFFEWARIMNGIQPKVFVAENVSGLVKGASFGYFKMIMEKLSSCGYVVAARLLNAKWLGVPQARQRLIFVGVRNDIAKTLGLTSKSIPYPKPLPYLYSIRDAIPYMTSVVHDTSGVGGAGEVINRPSPAITVGVNSLNSCHFKVGPSEEELAPARAAMDTACLQREWGKTQVGKGSEKYFSFVKPDPERPSPTILAIHGTTCASVVHPYERRKFTIREVRRICAFPDDFQLTGTYAQQWERLGRSVPPRMMFHVAATLRDEIFAPLGLVTPGWKEAN